MPTYRSAAFALYTFFFMLASAILLSPQKARAVDPPVTPDYASPAAVQRAENFLLCQTYTGGWPRNVDLGDKAYSEEEKQALRDKYSVKNKPGTLEEDTNIDATLLDRTTTDKIEFMSHVYVATGKTNAALAKSVEKAIFYLLMAEAPKGGYMAYFPTPSFKRAWHKNILFTDDVSFATVELLRLIGAGQEPYDWVKPNTRAAAAKAAARFRSVLVKSQVRVRKGMAVSVAASKGIRTGWSSRHDSKALTPAWGRDVEPRSLSPATTARIVRWLMQFEDPTPQEKTAIHTAIAWLHGRKIRPVGVDEGPRDHWAKCVEVSKNRPIYGDYVGYTSNGGRPVDQYFHRWEDVSLESRQENDWFVPADLELLGPVYAEWRAKHSPNINLIEDEDNDGLVDRWEEKYGLDPTDPSDGTADSDRDGADNLTEYHAGTHPTLSIVAPSRRFFPNTHVTINTIGGEAAEVRYSSDGGEPSRKTRRYRKPIRINDTLTIKATAYVGDLELPIETVEFNLIGKIHHAPFDGVSVRSPAEDIVGQQSGHILGFGRKERWAPGKIGNALLCSGSGGYVSFSSPRLGSHQGAMALWANPADTNAGKRFLGHAYRVERHRVELFTQDGKLAVRIGLKDPAFIGEALPVDQWTHLALVWNWGKFDLYRDGKHVHRGEYKDFDAQGALVGIGGYYRNTEQSFVGRIDDVHVYNRAATAEEIEELFQLGAASDADASENGPDKPAADDNNTAEAAGTGR